MSDALRYENGRLLDGRATAPAGADAIEDRFLFRKRGSTYEAGILVLVPTWGPEWFASALDDISRVASLRRDWDGEGSPAPSPAAVGIAVRLLQSLIHYSLPFPFVSPLRGGGLQVEWQQAERELEVEFWDAPELEYLKVLEDGSMEEGRCPSSDFQALRQLVKWLTGAA